MNSFIGPKRFRPPALTVSDLPDDLDAIFISHNHFDHLDYRSVKDLNKRYGARLTWFCGRGIRPWFSDMNVKNVVELDWWEEYHFIVREDLFEKLSTLSLCFRKKTSILLFAQLNIGDVY